MSGQNENINNNLKNIQEEEHLITFQDIVKDKEIKTYLEMGDKYLGTLGYTASRSKSSEDCAYDTYIVEL